MDIFVSERKTYGSNFQTVEVSLQGSGKRAFFSPEKRYSSLLVIGAWFPFNEQIIALWIEINFMQLYMQNTDLYCFWMGEI